VLRHLRLTKPQSLDELAHRRLSRAQRTEELAATCIGDGVERIARGEVRSHEANIF
jgi:hypothetical protein